MYVCVYIYTYLYIYYVYIHVYIYWKLVDFLFDDYVSVNAMLFLAH